MALANYSDLSGAIANWLNRADLTARVDDFISLAEAEFNRRLRTLEMEATAYSVLTGDKVAVPADFMGLRSIVIDGSTVPLEYLPPADLFDNTMTGVPEFYTIVDGMFQFRPSPASGTCRIVYTQKIPTLSAVNTTNWLMTKWPDLYLFSALAQAEFYGWNDARLPVIKQRIEEIFAQIEGAVNEERFGGRRLITGSTVANVRSVMA